MVEFSKILQDIGVKDVKTKGPKYTWCNKRTGRGRIMERVDRFMANQDWMKTFPDAQAWNLGYYGTDH
ncbi:hypothetical protein ACS0TY_005654 [Phlomoides rotata]